MKKQIRLGEFWAWLPAFRAVAEAESLAVASRSLRVTPSALSRTIRLVEVAVGQPLFLREGRRLRLSRAGDLLLSSVRTAMRALDDGVASMTDRSWDGTFTVAAPAWFARRFVLPALEHLRADHAGLVPVLERDIGASSAAALLRGDVDLAISWTRPSDARLVTQALPPLALALYDGGHGAAGEEAGVVAAPFAGVVELDEAARLARAWARVGLDVAVDVCRSTGLRAVLPVAIAGELRWRGPAERGPLELWVAMRPQPGMALEVAAAIAGEMG